MQPLWKTVYGGASKNKKIEPPCGPTVLLLGVHPQEMKSLCQRSKKDLYTQIYCNNTRSSQGVETSCMLVTG